MPAVKQPAQRTDVKRREDLSEFVNLACERYGKLRVTIVSPGFVQTKLADSMKNPEVKAHIVDTMANMAIPRMRSLVPLRSRSSSLPMLM
jgi:hypothetical protein